MIKSDLEYLLDVVPGYTCDMSPRDLQDYIKEAMILKKKDQDKEDAQFTLTEDEIFNEQ